MGGVLGGPGAGGQLCAVMYETNALPSLLRVQLSGGRWTLNKEPHGTIKLWGVKRQEHLS